MKGSEPSLPSSPPGNGLFLSAGPDPKHPLPKDQGWGLGPGPRACLPQDTYSIRVQSFLSGGLGATKGSELGLCVLLLGGGMHSLLSREQSLSLLVPVTLLADRLPGGLLRQHVAKELVDAQNCCAGDFSTSRFGLCTNQNLKNVF